MARVSLVRTAVLHTADLDEETLAAARGLLDEVFAPEMTDEDWEHCLGGVHALVWEGSELVGHAALVQRRLLHAGRALRTGYVEGVAVRAGSRGRGYGAAMMAELERVARRAYDLAALGSTEQAVAFYAARGWQSWLGPTCALTPHGVVRTPDEDGWILVLPLHPATEVPLDLAGELACDWRDGDAW
ncbi:GNAT family N-acetyltransferase [Kitasatospora sp. NPDC059571]|uniref:GNAT family N-acetyltransferase n=1 Tax=Kitasatospora sp. NPDC059571 TaxID=3346871 RepID=UPI0036AAB863